MDRARNPLPVAIKLKLGVHRRKRAVADSRDSLDRAALTGCLAQGGVQHGAPLRLPPQEARAGARARGVYDALPRVRRSALLCAADRSIGYDCSGRRCSSRSRPTISPTYSRCARERRHESVRIGSQSHAPDRPAAPLQCARHHAGWDTVPDGMSCHAGAWRDAVGRAD